MNPKGDPTTTSEPVVPVGGAPPGMVGAKVPGSKDVKKVPVYIVVPGPRAKDLATKITIEAKENVNDTPVEVKETNEKKVVEV